MWTAVFQERQPSMPEEKLRLLSDRRAVQVLEGLFDEALLGRVFQQTMKEERLASHERRLAAVLTGAGGGGIGLSSRQIFLLAISFIVCMVGISNAMLMSITERFREIATMKCLGATDPYILMQFMLEAGMQGLFGGVLGVLIGFVIAALRGYVAFGSHLASHWPWGDLAGSALASLAAGVLLSVLASIQPSWLASRMAPMEAMRVE